MQKSAPYLWFSTTPSAVEAARSSRELAYAQG